MPRRYNHTAGDVPRLESATRAAAAALRAVSHEVWNEQTGGMISFSTSLDEVLACVRRLTAAGSSLDDTWLLFLAADARPLAEVGGSDLRALAADRG